MIFDVILSVLLVLGVAFLVSCLIFGLVMWLMFRLMKRAASGVRDAVQRRPDLT